jgi:hypothetical protein
MDRRTFLRRSALVASGLVAADQLDLLARLGWVRRFFPSVAVDRGTVCGTSAQWDALLQEDYLRASIVHAINTVTPFRTQFLAPTPRTRLWTVRAT